MCIPSLFGSSFVDICDVPFHSKIYYLYCMDDFHMKDIVYIPALNLLLCNMPEIYLFEVCLIYLSST